LFVRYRLILRTIDTLIFNITLFYPLPIVSLAPIFYYLSLSSYNWLTTNVVVVLALGSEKGLWKSFVGCPPATNKKKAPQFSNTNHEAFSFWSIL